MPNWCNTTYKVVGEKDELEELYNILNRMQSRKDPVVENGFGHMWLGELVNELGYDWEKYKCRGEIMYFSYIDDVVTIEQYTAWNEQGGVRLALEKRFPSVKVYYIELEPGCKLFHTNDDTGKYFAERYYIDTYEGEEYFQTIKEAASYVERHFCKPVEPTFEGIKEALSLFQEERENEGEEFFYGFHEIEYCADL